jgi:hypothetical protein
LPALSPCQPAFSDTFSSLTVGPDLVTIAATHAWPSSSVARRGTYTLFTGEIVSNFFTPFSSHKPRDGRDTPVARKFFRVNRNNRRFESVGYQGGIRRSNTNYRRIFPL